MSLDKSQSMVPTEAIEINSARMSAHNGPNQGALEQAVRKPYPCGVMPRSPDAKNRSRAKLYKDFMRLTEGQDTQAS
jgi:hypothetical protein